MQPIMKMSSRLAPALGVLILAQLACGGGGAVDPVEFTIPVEVAEVATDSVEDLIITTGTLRALENVILNVETPGFLVLARDAGGSRLTEGSTVRKGQLIAEITGEDARLASRLDATKRHLETAEQEMRRRQRLFEEGLIAEEERAYCDSDD